MNWFYQVIDFTDEIDKEFASIPAGTPEKPWSEFFAECIQREAAPKILIPNLRNVQRAFHLYKNVYALVKSTYGKAEIMVNNQAVLTIRLFYDYFFEATRTGNDLTDFTKAATYADEVEILAREKKQLEISFTLCLLEEF